MQPQRRGRRGSSADGIEELKKLKKGTLKRLSQHQVQSSSLDGRGSKSKTPLDVFANDNGDGDDDEVERHALAGDAALALLAGLGQSTANKKAGRSRSTKLITEGATPRNVTADRTPHNASFIVGSVSAKASYGGVLAGPFVHRERGVRILDKANKTRSEQVLDQIASQDVLRSSSADTGLDRKKAAISRKRSDDTDDPEPLGMTRINSSGLRERRRGADDHLTLNDVEGAGRGSPLNPPPPSASGDNNKVKVDWGMKESSSPAVKATNASQASSSKDGKKLLQPPSPGEDVPAEDGDHAIVPLSSMSNFAEGEIEIRQIGFVQRWQRGNLIGCGSYGKVYLGMNIDSGELFVIKQVVFTDQQAISGCPNHEDVAQLEQEIALLATLDHDNIVKYLGTERNNLTNELSIFLEHMPGGSVADLVQRFGGLDEAVIRKYTREALEGLMYLHKRGIIHRDIKGQNILVDNRGACKLADFGASRYLKETSKTTNFSFKGTPVFMSPEVIMEQRYSRKSDVWSLGCTVIQMATGNPPYSEHSNHIAALFAITNSNKPPPIPDKLSDQAKQFLLRCFARDPAERASVEDLLQMPFVSTSTNKSSFDKDDARNSPSSSTVLANNGGEAAFGQLKAVSTEQDETSAWETWKERQWKTASKTVVRLKRGHVLERRKGGCCPHTSQTTCSKLILPPIPTPTSPSFS